MNRLRRFLLSLRPERRDELADTRTPRPRRRSPMIGESHRPPPATPGVECIGSPPEAAESFRRFLERLDLEDDARALSLEPWQRLFIEGYLAPPPAVYERAALRHGRTRGMARHAAAIAAAGGHVVISCATEDGGARLMAAVAEELGHLALIIDIDRDAAIANVETQTPGNPGGGGA